MRSGATAHRSDTAAITTIINSAKTTAAKDGGFALVGGFYVYVTVPYLYLKPIIGLGKCVAKFNALLSYGGPGECTGANWDSENKTCASGMTLKDTMKDQGRPGM